MKTKLPTVTLLGIDCVNIERLIQAAEICQKNFEFAEVKLLSSIKSDHPNIVPIDEIETIEAYSKFAIAEIDAYIDTPHVLIIQYDGFILNPAEWSDTFLDYDYIGAPWLVYDMFVNRFGYPKELLGQRIVGNGGFSLRSKKLISLCARLSRENFFGEYHAEDAVICVHNRKFLEEQGIRFAPVSVAEKFSFESEGNNNYKWNGQFGFHGLKWTDISKWLEKNPGYAIDNTLDRDKSKKKKSGTWIKIKNFFAYKLSGSYNTQL